MFIRTMESKVIDALKLRNYLKKIYVGKIISRVILGVMVSFCHTSFAAGTHFPAHSGNPRLLCHGLYSL